VIDVRDRFIHRVASGKSFADIGGLWGTVNEKASVAHFSGARELTMIDLSPADSHWWQKFEVRRQELKVPPVRSISGDVMQLAWDGGDCRFEVVHCSGILYHIPDQLRLLQALREITTDYLILTSSVTETCITNEAGELHVPQGGVLFLPALSELEKAVLRVHWWPTLADGALGLTRDIPSWRLGDFGPWWWLPTTEALQAMCGVAGFTVCELEHLWNGHAATLLLKAS
jgi:hypothetical protein